MPAPSSFTSAIRSRSAALTTSKGPPRSSCTHTSPLHAPSGLICQPVPAAKASGLTSSRSRITGAFLAHRGPQRSGQRRSAVNKRQIGRLSGTFALVLYQTPELTDADHAVLAGIDSLRARLGSFLRDPRRWHGTLRRTTFARAVQGSNSIEGYHASVEDVAALIDDEEPLSADVETRLAIAGYRDAMTYVLAKAAQPSHIDVSLL